MTISKAWAAAAAISAACVLVAAAPPVDAAGHHQRHHGTRQPASPGAGCVRAPDPAGDTMTDTTKKTKKGHKKKQAETCITAR